MTTIAPSLLACDFLNIQTEIERFDGESDLWLHLDLMDGHYVPNLTFGKPILKNIQNITKHKLDAHLMVSNPQDYVEELSDIGLHNFTFHWESVTHHDMFISFVKEHYPSVGVTLNPGTPVSVFPEYLIEKIDLILVMSVNPGFGGQKFIESALDKVKYFKKLKDKLNPKLEIQVDGGVTNENAQMLIEAGATNLVAGSYIFKEPNKDYSSRIKAMRKN